MSQIVLTQIAFDLLANQRSARVKVTGTQLRVVEAERAFLLSIGDSSQVIAEKGRSWEFPEGIGHFQVEAEANPISNILIEVTSGISHDTRLSLEASAGLGVNLLNTLPGKDGLPLASGSNTLEVSGHVSNNDSRSIIALNDATIEWVVVQNRGTTVLALSDAQDGRAAAVLLDPGEKFMLETGGPLWISNMSAVTDGAYAFLMGDRA